LVGIFNVVTENADRRSWVTLPAFAGMARVPLAAGPHLLELRHGSAVCTLQVTTVAGGRTLVWVNSTGPALRAYAVTFAAADGHE
jgi:hypothetical protein